MSSALGRPQASETQHERCGFAAHHHCPCRQCQCRRTWADTFLSRTLVAARRRWSAISCGTRCTMSRSLSQPSADSLWAVARAGGASGSPRRDRQPGSSRSARRLAHQIVPRICARVRYARWRFHNSRPTPWPRHPRAPRSCYREPRTPLSAQVPLTVYRCSNFCQGISDCFYLFAHYQPLVPLSYACMGASRAGLPILPRQSRPRRARVGPTQGGATRIISPGPRAALTRRGAEDIPPRRGRGCGARHTSENPHPRGGHVRRQRWRDCLGGSVYGGPLCQGSL